MAVPESLTALILGCGYTGGRVARTLAARGLTVYAVSRRPEDIAIPGVDAVPAGELAQLPAGLRVLHSVPLSEAPQGFYDPTPELLALLPQGVERIVYISSTGVYGAQREVDEHTLPAPRSPSATLRVSAENTIQAGPWSSMILRPAAIYGPGRGAHVSIPRGGFKLLGDGSNYVSRIHVDDLAAICEAALLSSHTGAWPVADDEPATSREIAGFVCNLTGCPFPPSAPATELDETRRADRRVDGRAVRRLLGVSLHYPSYRTGIPACLANEPAP